ncbi:MAG: PAS domain-containing protein [Chitinophagaceae bacterium]|nr:PAS domain-containing protein [Oligoflexus sp.]
MTERIFVSFEDYYKPLDLWTEVWVYPKNDDGLAVFFTNISERKNIERKIAFETLKLETVFQYSPVAMALWRGPDFIFERLNFMYQRSFPDTPLLGRPLFDALPQLRGQSIEMRMREVFETGHPFAAKEVLVTFSLEPDGMMHDTYHDITCMRIFEPDGTPYGAYVHSIDVTEKVKARLDLEQAKIEAENANQTKSLFLANMSHEIRTPLAAILGFAELLRDTSITGEERDRFIQTIVRNSKSLTRIIDDILDLAKIESGMLETEEKERTSEVGCNAHLTKPLNTREFVATLEEELKKAASFSVYLDCASGAITSFFSMPPTYPRHAAHPKEDRHPYLQMQF